jgi:hypothetical protein
MKDNIIIAAIVAIALIVSSLFIKIGMEKAGRPILTEVYSLFSSEGVVYRLNKVNGRMDVLVPSNEAALLFPVSTMQFPDAKTKMTNEEKASLARNVKMVSRYIQGERARNLGVEIETGGGKATKQPA